MLWLKDLIFREFYFNKYLCHRVFAFFFSAFVLLNSLSTVGELLNKEDMILFLLMCLSDIIYDFMIVLSTRLSETDVSTILTTLQCKFSIYCLVIGVVSVSMFL